MDRDTKNVLAACFIAKKVEKLFDEAISTASWAAVDKTKLPEKCFLWVEDPNKKKTWHLPYREGEGAIDPKTGMYESPGPVNINALRAIAGVIAGARTGEPMNLPDEIKSKINRLLKKYKVGDYNKQEGKKMGSEYHDFVESVFANSGLKHDKEKCIVHGMAILGATSVNCSKEYKGGKGRRYSEQALNSTARLINGAKSYINHATRQELEERGGVRDIRDLLGYFENGRVDGKTVRADFHYHPTHKEWFGWIVENMADKIGGSIHAFGPSVFNKSEMMEEVEDIKYLQSADIVPEPGSTTNLFESLRRDKEKDMDMTTIKLSDLKESRPDLIAEITKSIKESTETKDLLAAKDEKIKTLEEQNKKLTTDLDSLQVKEALAKKESVINAKIEESKLPKEVVTEVFRKTLKEAKDETAIDELIEDRKKLVAESKTVKGMGDENDPDKKKSFEENKKDYTECIEGYKENKDK